MKSFKRSMIMIILLSGMISMCLPSIKSQSGSAGIDEIEKNNEVSTK